MDNREAWSKERIEAEREELEKAASWYFWLGLPSLMGAFMCLFFGVGTAMWAAGGLGALFILVGIALLLGGIFLLRRFFQKRRQRKELKERL